MSDKNCIEICKLHAKSQGNCILQIILPVLYHPNKKHNGHQWGYSPLFSIQDIKKVTFAIVGSCLDELNVGHPAHELCFIVPLFEVCGGQ